MSISITQRFVASEAARALRARNPFLPDALATIYVAFSVLIMAYSVLFAVAPILVFLALWLPLPLLKGAALVKPTRDAVWVFALPVLCLASTFWSTLPFKTLYLAAALGAMMLCVLILSRAVRFRSLMHGVLLGVVVVLGIALASGRYAEDYFTHSQALTGYFGSKNMTGFFAQIGMMVSSVLFFTHRGLGRKLVYAVLPFSFCALCLVLSRSGTAALSLMAVLPVMGWVALLPRIPSALRPLFVAVSAVLLLMTIGFGFTVGAENLVLKMFGKDSTLTGRTYLWHEGMKIGAEAPLLGHGYGAFWQQGQPLAERYWYEFHIAARTGFHFHSGFIQAFVDLGAVGLALVAMLVLMNLVQSLRAMLRVGVGAETLLLFGFALMFLMRGFVEVDFLGPFGMGVLLFYCIIPRTFMLLEPASTKAPTDASVPSGIRE